MASIKDISLISTRPEENNQKLAHALHDSNIEVLNFPLTKIEGLTNYTFLNEQLKDLNSYQYLIFISTNAVRYFFEQIKVNKIKVVISKVYPNYEISETKENRMNYALCTIRRHEKGKKVPLHKDNVTYEGIEYNVSKIDNQISCILHLQETERGGKLLIYKKKWEKKFEEFREIEFGYNSILTKNVEVDKIEPKIGDLVIINPNYLHEITKIQGNTDRITLGMFFGIQNKSKKIFSWA